LADWIQEMIASEPIYDKLRYLEKLCRQRDSGHLREQQHGVVQTKSGAKNLAAATDY
jgi:hypothetical protein